MQKTFMSIGFILLGWGWTIAPSAIAKPAKAPSSGVEVTEPSGAGALTGTSGAGTVTKPSGAESLTQKWQTFKGAGIELSLPGNYRGGSPNTKGLQTLIGEIRSLGADYEQIARTVERNPTIFRLIAVDPKPDATGGVTNVVVSAAKVPETVAVDAYIDAVVKTLPDPFRMIERKTVQVGQYTAGRLVIEAGAVGNAPADRRLKQLTYVIKQGTTFWTVAYSTGAIDYPQRLAIFERSIESFKVQSAQKPDTPSGEKKPVSPLPPQTKPSTPAKPKPNKQ